MILRPHDTPGAIVLEAAVRSFPPVDPVALRWKFPVWTPAPDLNPKMLRNGKTKQVERQAANDDDGKRQIIDALRKQPLTVRKLIATTGLSRDRCNRLLDILEEDGHVTSEKSTVKGNKTNVYTIADSDDQGGGR